MGPAVIAAIVTAEVLFWVFLLGGLSLRYIVRARRASSGLLIAVPLVDLALLVFVTIDIAGGADPSQPHALAALYLGFTVAFGHSVVRWADVRFRHRFAGGPAPTRPPKGSRAEARAVWIEWARTVLAAVIAAAGLLVMIMVDGGGTPSSIETAAQHPYWATMLLLCIVVVLWFLAGPAFAGRGSELQHASGNGRR